MERELTVSKKRRRVEEEDGKHTETEETFRKFGINLGSFRTEAEKLTELHQKYICVKVLRDNMDWERLSCPKGGSIMEAFDQSEGPQRKKEYSFRPMNTMFKKT